MYFIVRELSEKRDELLNERTNDKNFPNIFRFANLVFYDNYTRCTLSASLYVNCTELLLLGMIYFERSTVVKNWSIFFIARNSFKISE